MDPAGESVELREAALASIRSELGYFGLAGGDDETWWRVFWEIYFAAGQYEFATSERANRQMSNRELRDKSPQFKEPDEEDLLRILRLDEKDKPWARGLDELTVMTRLDGVYEAQKHRLEGLDHADRFRVLEEIHAAQREIMAEVREAERRRLKQLGDKGRERLKKLYEANWREFKARADAERIERLNGLGEADRRRLIWFEKLEHAAEKRSGELPRNIREQLEAIEQAATALKVAMDAASGLALELLQLGAASPHRLPGPGDNRSLSYIPSRYLMFKLAEGPRRYAEEVAERAYAAGEAFRTAWPDEAIGKTSPMKVTGTPGQRLAYYIILAIRCVLGEAACRKISGQHNGPFHKLVKAVAQYATGQKQVDNAFVEIMDEKVAKWRDKLLRSPSRRELAEEARATRGAELQRKKAANEARRIGDSPIIPADASSKLAAAKSGASASFTSDLPQRWVNHHLTSVKLPTKR